ncbi:MAG: tRNA (guanosine(46)-N7)-methyltransferase TrmB [Lactobacillales bacterium]|nr:tRNA (guanosine(46)-N7)-methyltransferase TrmB [Lactobacillales bacterium]
MRLKCVKGAKERVEASPYLILDPLEYKGKYQELFNNNNPIYIEIGMGKGNFIIENAKKYPDINFIGIEKYDSVIVRAIEKLENLEIPNLKLIRMDANNIIDVFDKEIDLVYLNFSDPWPKARHEKRRLSSHEFLKKYDLIFKNKKNIIMKTDNRKLFEFSIMSYTSYGYKINEISLDLYKDDITNNIPTEYEMKFNDMGFPIYKIDVEK